MFLVKAGPSQNSASTAPINNVTSTNGKQIIEISAKGGYSPRLSEAKADTPSVIRVKTNGTYDCSSYLVIPSVGYRSALPQTGVTDIEIPAQKSGTILQGLCGMGMYNFQVKFE